LKKRNEKFTNGVLQLINQCENEHTHTSELVEFIKDLIAMDPNVAVNPSISQAIFDKMQTFKMVNIESLEKRGYFLGGRIWKYITLFHQLKQVDLMNQLVDQMAAFIKTISSADRLNNVMDTIKTDLSKVAEECYTGSPNPSFIRFLNSCIQKQSQYLQEMQRIEKSLSDKLKAACASFMTLQCCDDCKFIRNQIMKDPQQIISFAAPEKKRKHIEQEMQKRGFVHFETIR